MQLLTINGSRFRFSSYEGLREAKSALNMAALAGGGFVDLRVDGHRDVSVLITPSSAVSIEEGPAPARGRALDDDSLVPWLDEL